MLLLMDLKPFVIMLHCPLLLSGSHNTSWMVSPFTSRNNLRPSLRIFSWELD